MEGRLVAEQGAHDATKGAHEATKGAHETTKGEHEATKGELATAHAKVARLEAELAAAQAAGTAGGCGFGVRHGTRARACAAAAGSLPGMAGSRGVALAPAPAGAAAAIDADLVPATAAAVARERAFQETLGRATGPLSQERLGGRKALSVETGAQFAERQLRSLSALANEAGPTPEDVTALQTELVGTEVRWVFDDGREIAGQVGGVHAGSQRRVGGRRGWVGGGGTGRLAGTAGRCCWQEESGRDGPFSAPHVVGVPGMDDLW